MANSLPLGVIALTVKVDLQVCPEQAQITRAVARELSVGRLLVACKLGGDIPEIKHASSRGHQVQAVLVRIGTGYIDGPE